MEMCSKSIEVSISKILLPAHAKIRKKSKITNFYDFTSRYIEFQISFVNRKVVLLDDNMLHIDPIMCFNIHARFMARA